MLEDIEKIINGKSYHHFSVKHAYCDVIGISWFLSAREGSLVKVGCNVSIVQVRDMLYMSTQLFID